VLAPQGYQGEACAYDQLVCVVCRDRGAARVGSAAEGSDTGALGPVARGLTCCWKVRETVGARRRLETSCPLRERPLGAVWVRPGRAGRPRWCSAGAR